MVSILDVMGFESLPKLSKTKDIVTYMIALETKAYGQAIDLPYAATYRNIKLLIKKYSKEEVVRGIFSAVHVSDYPFSSAFVEDMILQRRKDEACSALMMYENILNLNK